MDVYCTRPGCPRPTNAFADLDQPSMLRTVQQKFCTSCGMPLLLAGRYVPLRLLGRGGFGAAFLARDRFTPALRPCVVKQFQPSGNLSATQLQVAQNLFEREAQVLDELGNRHPQIPDLLAFFELDVPTKTPGKSDKFFYLVQEFIDGENLEEELGRRGRFSEAEVMEILEALLPVMKFVHDSGSIHRDIKPSNIMRRRDGRLFLLDFGAVRQVAATTPGGKASTGIYSMGFAPPEQMRGDTVYPATDLYALAVTCITLLTGQQPNELYDAFSNTWKWHDSATVSDRLAAVLDQMLLPTPSQRLQSAEEVLNALQSPPPSAPSSLPPPPLPVGGNVRAASPLSQGPPLPIHPSTHPPIHSPPNSPSTALQPPPSPTSPAPIAPPRPFSLMELIGNGAFTGFQGGLLAIALLSLLGTTTLTPVFWIALVGVLVLAQWRRWIERLDLVIIAAISLGLVLFLPFFNGILQASGAFPTVLVVAVLAALVGVAIALLFRLIYGLLSRIL